MKEFSFKTRTENLKKLAHEDFDLVIIGGGITGTGVARDAASRGLKVALIEAGDFASGTSSRSSKLIHGGIRYLENYEFHLVFEALNERQRLFHIAPHLVHPLKFVLPLYEGDRVGKFLMGLGMWLYDALALFDVPIMHYFMGPKRTAKHIPSIQTEGLKGAYV
jgi:glycerol-3-phosphate dehydrogenase